MEFKLQPKKICFKAFAIMINGEEKIKINNKEHYGEWVEGDLSQYFEHDYYIKNYIVVPETLGQFTGYVLEDDSKVFENDIIKITLCSGKEKFYLVWFNREILETVVIDIENIDVNGINLNALEKSYSIGDFHFLLSDSYGNIQNCQVIGNLFDDFKDENYNLSPDEKFLDYCNNVKSNNIEHLYDCENNLLAYKNKKYEDFAGCPGSFGIVNSKGVC